MIPYGRQTIVQSDIEAVVRALKSDFLTQGPMLPAFEQEVCSKVGAQHAIGVNSATSALHLACLALGIGPGDTVWTSPNSFVASANCALYCGASVDFVDIDPQTLCLSVENLETKLRECRKSGKPLPKAVIPVHFGGQSCDMPSLHKLAQAYQFHIIEDASHAIGARVHWPHQSESCFVGDCQFSDITVFSFHPVKIITTGEGGMATTNCPQLANRLQKLRSHGITRIPTEMDGETDGDWYYQMLELGLNYRLTDIQAALGLSQLARLDDYVSERQRLAAFYLETLQSVFTRLGVPLPRLQMEPAFSSGARHLFVVRVPRDTRARCFQALRGAGFGVNVHYIPIHCQPFYQKLGFQRTDFPESVRYYEEALSLPLFPGLSERDIESCVTTLAHVMSDPGKPKAG